MAHQAENDNQSILPSDIDLKDTTYDRELDTLYLRFSAGMWIAEPLTDSAHPESSVWFLRDVNDETQVIGIMIEDLSKHFLPRHKQ